MLRQPIKSDRRQRTARTYAQAAPILGLNGRDSMADMKEGYALLLDNWFPSTNQCVGRAGSKAWATGLGTASVETLVAYSSGTTQKLLAFANKAVYDASSSGAVGDALDTGYTNNRWQAVNYKGDVIAVNGTADGCIKYDGSSVSSNSVTGATGNLANITVFKNRLYFLDDTLSFYYLDTQAISGALTAFDLSTYIRFGGFLMAMGEWSYLGTNSINAYAVFISSEGEVIVFQGSDPSTSTDWSMAAQFRIGKPIGRRCMVKYGAELIILTEDGFVPVSSLMAKDRETPQQNISDVLGTLLSGDIHTYGGNFGWEGAVCSRSTLGPMAIFNVPTSENSSAHQYVVNLRTGAWCRFTGLDANTWCVYDNKIFFGGNDGSVYQADTGTADSDDNIVFDAKTAFTYMKAPDVLKEFVMARPIIGSNGSISAAVEANVDFEDKIPTATPTFTGSSGSPWDTSAWDTSPWGSDDQKSKGWVSVSGLGYAAALRVRVATNALSVTWASNDWLYLPGAIM